MRNIGFFEIANNLFHMNFLSIIVLSLLFSIGYEHVRDEQEICGNYGKKSRFRYAKVVK